MQSDLVGQSQWLPWGHSLFYYLFNEASLAQRRANSSGFRKRLAVKLQPIDDLVDHLALGAHREADEIELGADHALNHLAVGGVMRGLEHVLGIDRWRNVAGERPFERAGQRRTIGAVDQDRLADQ